MTKKYIIIILSFVSLNCFSQVNHYILFDITGSMIGRGTDNQGIANEDIWKKSIDLLEKQLKYFNNGDKVTLFLYGNDIYDKGTYTIDGSQEIVNNITANIIGVDEFETCTCTYYALNKVLEKIKSTNTKNTNRIYLFTDGSPTPNCNKNCSSIRYEKLKQKFDEIIRDSDYLFIYNLKPEVANLIDGENIKNIIKPFSEVTVFATPHNTTIVFNGKVHTSTQKFTFNGTGIDKFFQNNSYEVVMSNFELSYDEKTIKQKASLVRPNDSINKISLSRKPQTVKLLTANKPEVFDKEIYTGEITYTFSNGFSKDTLISDNAKLHIEILANKSKIIFNNKAEKPKVTIEFID
ncbi:hypothetical protein KORDIASMS9_02218 [Kordia sp. SMS9]|uniref:vWA domain-containing protein n=1 Tax=Kordia sp. SMS9 TaxID=2282170 RepID=UPI000E0D7234|nr:vWA domain-containing protein [Kordia sp. SMS9]AXG69989.1 hypothetical protein KORDIASMS9_02218 [Kordia sp. SMS9]